jgi:hypothetical protein
LTSHSTPFVRSPVRVSQFEIANGHASHSGVEPI